MITNTNLTTTDGQTIFSGQYVYPDQQIRHGRPSPQPLAQPEAPPIQMETKQDEKYDH